MCTAPVLLAVSGSAGMLLLGTDTDHAGNAVAASDPVQKLAYILAALTTLAGLIGIFRAFCKLLGTRSVVVAQSRPCEACSDSAHRAAPASAESICTLCGSGRSGSV